MSNLGAYQMVTTGIKAMGGPAKAGLIAVGSVVALTSSVYRFGVNRGVNMGDRQTAVSMGGSNEFVECFCGG
ncbi:hypothetical protein, partial [uncultured Actinomyces sp.]|uniref:hypothetical protein n=1 Tax=uncultured Actinomyces sp. TaxID=249061 RepID=UPI00261BFD35